MIPGPTTSGPIAPGTSTPVHLRSWVARRWYELGRRPSGHDVPGTLSVVSLAVLAAGLHLGIVHADAYVAWSRTPASLAVDLLGAACVAAAVAATYHVCARVGLSQTGRLLVVATFLVNPNLRGVVTQPRAALLLVGLLAASAGLTRWATATRTPSGGELAVYVGVPASVAVFAGPEGWLVVAAAAGVVALVQLRRGHGARSALTRAVCVGAVPVLSSGWWLVRSSVRGAGGSVIGTGVQPTLSTGTAIALGCLVLTVPVLAGLARLVRAERRRHGLRTGSLPDEPATRAPAVPHQRRAPGPGHRPGSVADGLPGGVGVGS